MSRSSSSAARDERAFTLLELLIALTIVVTLLAVAFAGLRVGLGAWRQGEARAEAHQHTRGIAVSLARVIAGAYPYAAARGPAPDPRILFNGTEQRLEVVTQAPPGGFALPIAFAAVVIEVTEGEAPGLVVRQRALPNENPFTEGDVVFRDPTIKALTFAYLDGDGSWRDTWDGAAEEKLPRAIRLSVTTESDGRADSIPAMTIGLRVLSP